MEDISPRRRGMTPVRVLLAAGVSQSFNIEGDYFHTLTAPVNDLFVRFDSGERVDAQQGVGFRRYYRDFTLASATGQTVVIFAGFGSVGDGRATANLNVTATQEPGNVLNNGGDVACANAAVTLLLAADVTRLEAVIVNPETNTATVRIGPVTVGAASGVPLAPGQTAVLATNAAIYARNDSGAPVTISATSIANV